MLGTGFSGTLIPHNTLRKVYSPSNRRGGLTLEQVEGYIHIYHLQIHFHGLEEVVKVSILNEKYVDVRWKNKEYRKAQESAP